MMARRAGEKSNQRIAMLARFGLANPRLIGKPFVLDPTNRAIDPCKEDWHGLEALAVGYQTGGDVPSRVRTSHHNGAHWPLLLLSLAHPIPCACENHLTQPRQERGIYCSVFLKNIRMRGTGGTQAR